MAPDPLRWPHKRLLVNETGLARQGRCPADVRVRVVVCHLVTGRIGAELYPICTGGPVQTIGTRTLLSPRADASPGRSVAVVCPGLPGTDRGLSEY